MSVVTDPKTGKKAFDLRVHIRDPKTGFVTKKQPYRLHVNRERGTYYERDGKLYYPNGELVNPPKPAVKAAAPVEVPPPPPAPVAPPEVPPMAPEAPPPAAARANPLIPGGAKP